MGYKQTFYFIDKQEGVIYSRKPQGTLDVNRLIHNQAPWKITNLASSLQQKTLILADWTAAEWPPDKLKAVQKNIRELMNQGFSVYMWQDLPPTGQVIKLTKQDSALNTLTSRSLMRPQFTDLIQKTAVEQCHLTKDKTLVLDDYWVECLLNREENTPPRRLSLSKLLNGQYQNRVLAVLKRAVPPVSEIIQDEFSAEANQMLLQVREAFPQAPIRTQYKKLVLNNQQVEDLFGEDARVSLHDAHLTPDQLEGVESLYVELKFDLISRNLENLLAKTLVLKEFKIKEKEGFLGRFKTRPQLESLEIFDASYSSLNTSNLGSLLSQASQLKTLNLRFCDGFNAAKLGELNLPNLERLIADNSSITTAILQAILAKANELRSLDLSRCGELNEHFTINFELGKLEELKFYSAKIPIANIEFLLARAPNLKLLDLSSNQELIKIDSIACNLQYLEELDVSQSPITDETLQHLLAKTSAIKRLNLAYCEQLAAPFTTSLNLKDLEKLTLTYSTISTNNLEYLLTQATKLKTLNLGKCRNLSNPFTTNFQLEALEILYLEANNLPLTNLQCLLANANSLKELDLVGCAFSGELTANLNLKKLEKINLSESNIKAEDLKALIRAAPNLKKLFLNECPELVIDQELESLFKGIAVYRRAVVADTAKLEDFRSLLKVKKTSSTASKSQKGDSGYYARTQSLDSKKTLDADTEYNPDKELQAKRYFYPLNPSDKMPAINDYRLEVYNKLEVNPSPCTLDKAFSLTNTGAHSLVERSISQTNNLIELGQKLGAIDDVHSYFLGRQPLIVTEDWQALASLSANEELTHYQTEPQDSAVEINYSERDNLYYIRNRSNKPESVQLDFLLKVKPPGQSPSIPVEITKLIDDYSHFGAKALKLEKAEGQLTGEDYLHYIKDQKTGACRHRTAAFKDAMAKEHPTVPVRIVDNDAHSFVEIQIEGQWLKRDLGGYPTKLSIDESLQPDFITEKPLETHLMVDAQPQVFHPDERIRDYEKLLETWTKSSPYSASVLGYCQQLTQSTEGKKRLVELESTADVEAMHLSLQGYCQSISRPFFYVNSPDDLICSAAYLAREKDSAIGRLTKGPGGPLYDFLKAQQEKANPPVLIVNYDNFDADDIVRFNGLLDSRRHADGTELPEDMLVIGLINTSKVDCYQGEDFYSRFDSTEECPLPSEKLAEHQQIIAPLPLQKADETGPLPQEKTAINLYHAPDWEDRLLGRWVLKKDRLYFEEGELEQALATGLPIEIHNGPWQDEKFKLFWRQACLRGHIEHAGRRITIPKSLSLIPQEGYHWEALGQQVSWEAGLVDEALVLNPGSLSDFFTRYECDNASATLDTLPGLIEERAHQRLAVNLTASLGSDEWARLLAKCQQHQVQLTVHCAPHVVVPAEALGQQTLDLTSCLPLETPAHTGSFISSDIDTTLNQLTRVDSDWQIIDVSECGEEDLLVYTEAELNAETGELRFQQSKKALLQALEQDKKVILKGQFSPELVDSLSPLLLERQKNTQAKGHLVLLSGQESFPYLASKTHEVKVEEKEACLLRHYNKEEIASLEREQLEQESLSQLKARLNFRRLHSEGSTDDAWLGLLKLPDGVSLKPFDAAHSADLAEAFNQQRKDATNQILTYSPCVCLTGITGTGKSTFVEKNFDNETDSLYIGESEMVRWAEDKSAKRKILFIDEANLSPKQWSEFEGLFNDPPGILIKGKYYPLTDQHKVIFASNPLSYGDERKLAPFFIRHGAALVIEPLSQEFIYEYVLKPVFAETALAEHSLELCRPLLQIYAFLCQCSDNEVLISPRELQMMAMMVMSHYHQHPDVGEALIAAHHYAYQIATKLVPELHRAELKQKFAPTFDWQRTERLSEAITQQDEFHITASRQPVIQLIDDFLALREFKQGEKAVNDTQRYGGITGLVLEGAPGVGKSELFNNRLLAHGYQEIHYDEKERLDKILPEKGFYRMPVSMSTEDKKKLLLKAFHGGHGVLIDEINSSPMMERFLNALLMSKTPEGKFPDKSGFFVLGTQNPVTMSGRRAPSTALARRLITLSLPEYPQEEIKEILIVRGLESELAGILAAAFMKNVKKAKEEHLIPSPTFRDLLRLADKILLAEKCLRETTEKSKGKEKLVEKKPVEPLSFTEKQFFIEALKQLCNDIQRQLIAKDSAVASKNAFFSVSQQPDLTASIKASEKVILFLEKGTSIDGLSHDELEALNNDSLGKLMKKIGEAKLLTDSGIELTDTGFQKREGLTP